MTVHCSEIGAHIKRVSPSLVAGCPNGCLWMVQQPWFLVAWTGNIRFITELVHTSTSALALCAPLLSSPSISVAVCVNLFLQMASHWQLQKVVQGNLAAEQLNWAVTHWFAEENPHLINSETTGCERNIFRWDSDFDGSYFIHLCFIGSSRNAWWFLRLLILSDWSLYKMMLYFYIFMKWCYRWWDGFRFWCCLSFANFLCPYSTLDIWHVFILARLTCIHNKLSGLNKHVSHISLRIS